MTIKKKIPLAVLELLEPYLAKGIDSIRTVEPETSLLKFVDSDEKSEFHFTIEQAKYENKLLLVLVDREPRNKEIVASYRTWIDATTLENNFNDWVGLINRYNNIKSIYDDPIEKKYQDEFYADFEIIEEDADVYSFNLAQQIWIDNYLDKIILTIDKFDIKNEISDLQEIKESSQVLRDDLTRLSKKQIIQKLSKIWAKARKHGLIILKEIYIEFRNELIKQLIKGQLNG
ncbi:MAG: hypothetical protein CVT99_13915 [Bacteroidetes bacterium HGW-Bacteroidetes-16]|jgi:hypothetical protein|nr:MAG: hypothetical protein CVT99_13915 [Bacteroidetes bacterium HGW-Bacteroidetes-16]